MPSQINRPITFTEAARVFVFRAGQLRWRHSNKIAGAISEKGYRRVKYRGRLYMAHRLVWLITRGDWPALGLDHRDGDKLNNRPGNLREANQSENMRNIGAMRSNTSGLKGVSPSGSKWIAQICIGRKVRYLGRFNDPETAHAAYCDAAARLHGDFARFK